MSRRSELFTRKYLRFWLMMLGAVLALTGFVEVVEHVFHEPMEGELKTQTFDRVIGGWISGIRSPKLTQVMTDLTALGSVSVITTLFVVLVSVLATFRDFRGIVFLSAVGLGAGLWPPILKAFFGRERPKEVEQLVRVTDLSFPSGHAFTAAAAYIALAYYSGRYARSWCQEKFFYCLGGILIVIVCVSRIYLGVHFPTDVLGGLGGGAAWGFLASAVHELLCRRRKAQ